MLRLIKPNSAYQTQYQEMMVEWCSAGEDIVPYSIARLNYKEFDQHLEGFKEEEKGILYGGVPATTFWAYDEDRDKIVGAVNIRHWLNDRMLRHGGHIGDGVRPSERRKGYATKMIALALDECRKMGMKRVLMVCYQHNVGSRKSIIKNGGVLENENTNDDGTINQRFWIEL